MWITPSLLSAQTSCAHTQASRVKRLQPCNGTAQLYKAGIPFGASHHGNQTMLCQVSESVLSFAGACSVGSFINVCFMYAVEAWPEASPESVHDLTFHQPLHT